MNKKDIEWMKIIDFLNMIHSGVEFPEKIIISGHRYKFNEQTKDYDSDIGFANKDLFLHIGILKELDTEIGILKNNTKEIEQLDELSIDCGCSCSEIKQTIDKLVKAVNCLRKEKE